MQPVSSEDRRTDSVNIVEVLIAEPDRQTASVLRDLVLRVRADAFVHCVADGQAVLAYCEHRLPDVVIADHDLPGVNGVELLRLMRRRERAVPLPFILISSHLDAASVRAALPLAPSAYLAKPLNQENLLGRLQGLLESLHCLESRPSISLDQYLERVRNEGHGAPLFENVREMVGLSLSTSAKDLGELEAAFARDPQITSMLIFTANSAAQHLGAPCQTLAQAIPRLGVSRTLNLVLSLALQRSATLTDERLAGQAKEVLARSVRSAELARWLASDLKLDANLCYTAALLHNIGELALLRGLQSWLDCGGELSDEEIADSVQKRSAGFGSALRIYLRLSLSLRELIAAFYRLERGIYSREALVLNLTGCLLQLPDYAAVRTLAEQRCASMLQMDAPLLERIPEGLYR